MQGERTDTSSPKGEGPIHTEMGKIVSGHTYRQPIPPPLTLAFLFFIFLIIT